jgi:hypothetical protein
MTTGHHWLTAPLLVLMTACIGGSSQDQAATVVRDSAGVLIVQNGSSATPPIWTVAATPSVVIGGNERDAGSQLFRAVSATRLPNGLIAVGNVGTSEVLIFAADGRRLGTYGRRGRGPGEFSGSMMRVLPSNSDDVVAEDLGLQRKLIRFTLDGLVDSEIVLAPAKRPSGGAHSDPATSPGGVGFVLSEPLPNDPEQPSKLTRPSAHVLRFSFSGEGRLDTVATYPGAELFYADVGPRPAMGGGTVTGPRPISPLFQASTRLAGGGSPWRIAVGDQSKTMVDVYDEAGRQVQRIGWSSEVRPPSTRDMEVARDRYVESRRLDRPGALRSLDAMPSIDRTPVFDEVTIGRDNNLWIRRYSLPTDENAHWWVFAPDGKMIAVVDLPADRTLLEAGTEYVLLHAVDDLGIERIELWHLEKQESPE